MRACSVNNGLILCRGHCFTIVAHNWKFWQTYFAWNIVPKLYMCIFIVLWMYFLILTPEPEYNSLSSCLLYCLFEDFPGTSPALVQAAPTFTVLYILFLCVCSFKRAALRLKWAWTLSGEMHFDLFNSPRWVSNRKDCPSPINLLIYLSS